MIGRNTSSYCAARACLTMACSQSKWARARKPPSAADYMLRTSCANSRHGAQMDHLERSRQEFARQAAGFAASPATTDRQLAQRLVDAIGPNAAGIALDVACGPGIVTAALAAVAREVVAFDLTPQMLAKAGE